MAFTLAALLQGKSIYQAARQKLTKNCEDSYSAIGFTAFFGGPDRIINSIFDRFKNYLALAKERIFKEDGVMPTDDEVRRRVCMTSSSDLPKSDKKGKPMFAFINAMYLYNSYNKEDLESTFGSPKEAFRAFLSVAMSYTDVYMVIRDKLVHFAGCTMSGGPNTVENNTTYHIHLAFASAIMYYIEKTPGQLFSAELEDYAAFLGETLYTPRCYWDFESVKKKLHSFVDYITAETFYCKFLSDDCIRYYIKGQAPEMAYSVKDYYMYAGYEMGHEKYHEQPGGYDFPEFCSAHPVVVDGTFILASVRPQALLVNLLYALEANKVEDPYIRLARILAAIVCFTPSQFDESQPLYIRQLADHLINFVRLHYGEITMRHLKQKMAEVTDSSLREVVNIMSFYCDESDNPVSQVNTKDILQKFYMPRTQIEFVKSTCCDICNAQSLFHCVTCQPFGELCLEHATLHQQQSDHRNWALTAECCNATIVVTTMLRKSCSSARLPSSVIDAVNQSDVMFSLMWTLTPMLTLTTIVTSAHSSLRVVF